MYVDLPLDRARKLRFTINAMRELENKFGGISLAKLFNPDTAGIDTITHLIWIGLKHGGDNRITVDDVGRLLQEYFLDAGKPLSDAMEYVTRALRQGGFIPKEGAEENPPQAGEGEETPSQ